MDNILRKNPNLIKRCINILEEGKMPKQEERFNVLRNLYKLEDTKKGTLVEKVEIHKACYEVLRLTKIGTPESEINKFIESI